MISAPASLEKRHSFEGFDCGRTSLNDWLFRHARQAQASGSAKTFVVTNPEQQVVGYYSLTVGQVETLSAPERIRQGMGAYPIPVVILARLAVSITAQGRGIGSGLLKDAIKRTLLISEQAGIRAMLTHPLDDQAAQFYLQAGFIASPLQDNQYLLLLKDAKKILLSTSPTQT